MLFRDSKQFTGLLDCQARAASALDFHFNASLATLNLVRAADLGMQQGQEPHVFWMASWKQCQFNERFLDIFMENLTLDPTWVKNHSCYEELRTYGAITVLIFVRTIDTIPSPKMEMKQGEAEHPVWR